MSLSLAQDGNSFHSNKQEKKKGCRSLTAPRRPARYHPRDHSSVLLVTPSEHL